MSTEPSLARTPTIWAPEALRPGLTVGLVFSENTGRALSVLIVGLDDERRPVHLKLDPMHVIRLAEYCTRTLPEDER